ncbi:hypothetical protein I4F81_004133 [Pyropia yezoensis]|uniref:Uncharacterized protein n=1 Tax=Pyropia yezoensis TaxID=2788 RepID=A0ACC3BV22_PYRYE|nr:hypothetical protein I4F81_004133 [Neopyropia yezoensis]
MAPSRQEPDAIHAVVRTLCPPLGVTAAATGCFDAAITLGGGSHVEHFAGGASGSGSGSGAPPPSPPSPWYVALVRRTHLDLYTRVGGRLRHHASTPLHAVATAAAAVRIAPRRHVLVLALSGMRLAALAWRPDTGGWHTVQILQLGAAHRRLSSGTGGAFALAADGTTLAPVVPPNDHPFRNDDIFAVDLHAAGIRSVRSAVVLAGTFEPTVLLLYEPRRTWAGRLAAVRATAAVAAVSVDAAARTGTVLWKLEGLPHDAATLAAVPDAGGGGGLVLSPSVVLHVRHGGLAAALSVNVFGDVWAREAPPPLRDPTRHSEVVLSLDQAKAAFLADEDRDGRCNALLSLKGGELTSVAVDAAATATDTPIDGGLASAADDQAEDADGGTDKDGAPSEEDSEDDELYDDASSDGAPPSDSTAAAADPWRRRPSSRRWALKVRDSLPCFGPGADVAVGPSPGSLLTDPLDPAPPPPPGGPGGGPRGLELVLAAGAGKSEDGAASSAGSGAEKEDTLPAVDEEALRVAAAERFPFQDDAVPEELPPPDEAAQHAYVLLSTATGSLLLATGGVGELAQVPPGDYIASAPTLAAGNVLANRAAVQVTADGARLLHGRRLAATFSLPDNEHDPVVAAQVTDPYVLLRLASGGLLVLRAAADEVQRPGGAAAALRHITEVDEPDDGEGDGDGDGEGVTVKAEPDAPPGDLGGGPTPAVGGVKDEAMAATAAGAAAPPLAGAASALDDVELDDEDMLLYVGGGGGQEGASATAASAAAAGGHLRGKGGRRYALQAFAAIGGRSGVLVSLDAPLPLRRVPLRCSIARVAYHAATATYGALVGVPAPPPPRRAVREAVLAPLERHERHAGELRSLSAFPARPAGAAGAGASPEDEAAIEARLPPLAAERHEVRLYRPDTWELLHAVRLSADEAGLSMASMSVDVFKVTGTGPEGASRQDGYTGASGVAFAAFQLQLIAEKEVKGQVTALAPLEGHVLAAVGPRLEVYKLVGDDIVCCSFFSAQLLTSSVATVKQYILAADAFKSTTLLYWRDRNKSLNFLAQDLQPAHAYAADFVVSGGGLGLLLADGGGNLQLLGYANAAVPESRGGTRLLSHGALHLGARVNRFTRATLFVTLEGGIGAVTPVPPAVAAALAALSARLCAAPPAAAAPAGTSPAAFRAFRPPSRAHAPLRRRLVDGDGPAEGFAALDAAAAAAVARSVGRVVAGVAAAAAAGGGSTGGGGGRGGGQAAAAARPPPPPGWGTAPAGSVQQVWDLLAGVDAVIKRF